MTTSPIRKCSVFSWLSSVSLVCVLAGLASAQPVTTDSSRLKAVGQVAFTEGPVWHPDGSVYFTDVENNRIMRRTSDGQIRVFRSPSGRANGLVFDLEGRLLACEGNREGGNRRVTRTETNGSITVLADKYNGKRFNSPNDITIDSKGTIYFTDPRYGDHSDVELVDESGVTIEGVYRIGLDGEVQRILKHEVERPNGIAVSPDDRYLYVADNANDTEKATRKLWQFEIGQDGEILLASQRELFDWGTERGPDGMAIDKNGRLFVTAGLNFPAPPHETATRYKAAVYVIDPTEGDLLETIPIPMDAITNCAFGGEDLKTLFITSGHKLWSIPVKVPGHVAWVE